MTTSPKSKVAPKKPNKKAQWFKENPDQFIDSCMFKAHFGPTPPPEKDRIWIFPKLHETLQSVRRNKNTVVVSCNGFGKTFIASVTAAEFLCLNKDSIVITTAPTWKQVEMLLWGEIRSRFNNARKKLVSCPVNLTSIKISDKWYAIGLSTDKEEQFQGFHAKKILVIIDEASGVDRKIYKAISGIVNNDNARLLAIGNHKLDFHGSISPHEQSD